jgi:hypothetical protein
MGSATSSSGERPARSLRPRWSPTASSHSSIDWSGRRGSRLLPPADQVLEGERTGPGRGDEEGDLTAVASLHAEDQIGLFDGRRGEPGGVVAGQIGPEGGDDGRHFGRNGTAPFEEAGRGHGDGFVTITERDAEKGRRHRGPAHIRGADEEDDDTGSVDAGTGRAGTGRAGAVGPGRLAKAGAPLKSGPDSSVGTCDGVGWLARSAVSCWGPAP